MFVEIFPSFSNVKQNYRKQLQISVTLQQLNNHINLKNKNL